ncbi:MAG: hypothetical protein JSW50_01055, partial [Candidatus Latescibacterota bacterium]
YFADGTVVNLDGLVNNIEYLRYLRENRFPQFILDPGIEFIGNKHVRDGDIRIKTELEEAGFGFEVVYRNEYENAFSLAFMGSKKNTYSMYRLTYPPNGRGHRGRRLFVVLVLFGRITANRYAGQ